MTDPLRFTVPEKFEAIRMHARRLDPLAGATRDAVIADAERVIEIAKSIDPKDWK